ncbi:hypothetical protein [Gryllotalpicola koreensis]|uniref:DUF222 domain-containing protein n=1 Tax=Gryllotalpicola koreensis TaxID=993086 RepID=A0ABP8A854_9MICO
MKLAERLDNASDDLNARIMLEATCIRLRDWLEAERVALEAELKRASAQVTVHPIAFVGDLVEQPPTLTTERRREALRLLVGRITINPSGAEKRVDRSPTYSTPEMSRYGRRR